MTAIACPVTADQIIAAAAAQIGVAESPHGSNKQPYGEWYGLNGVAWCAIFVSWVMHDAGWDGFAISTKKGYSYCPAGAQWFKDRGAWADAHTVPKRGWIVFFDFPGDGVNRISHTGIVEGVLADGRVATIEGNTSDAGGRTGGIVMRHNRTPAGGIVGYGALQFPNLSEEDDMPLSQDDREWLTEKINGLAEDLTGLIVRQVQTVIAAEDPKTVAAEIAKHLPAGSASSADVEAAVRKVFADAGDSTG